MTDNSDVVDLSADMPLATYDLKIVRPGTATPIGWVVTLAGPAHAKRLAFKNVAARERLHKQAVIEASQVNNRKYKADEKSPDEAELETMRWVVSNIVTWTPIKIGGEVIAFSDEAAITLLRKPEMAVYLQQIVDYLTGERAFMPASATN